jgi:hypothetical protein
MANRGRPRKIDSETTDNNELDNENDNANPIEDSNEIEQESPRVEKEQIIGEGTYSDYNPFAESVIERDYSTPKTASGVIEDIDEPSFVPPSYEDIIQERENEKDNEFEQSNPFDNPNPSMNDLTDKDKRIACESLVDTCLDAYEQLHVYGQMFVKVDEEVLLQKQAENKLDLSVQIPISENGETMSMGEFVSQFNEQSAEALKYDKEFGYKVRPAMIRVFTKRGWGMTDEQFLLYMFGKDIAVKFSLIYSLKKTINSSLTMFEKLHQSNNVVSANNNYDTTTKGVIIEDEEYIDEDYENPMFEDIETYTTADEKPTKEEFTKSMNINMPMNPKDSMSQHPKEVQRVLKKSK